jgi:hypothetical protein
MANHFILSDLTTHISSPTEWVPFSAENLIRIDIEDYFAEHIERSDERDEWLENAPTIHRVRQTQSFDQHGDTIIITYYFDPEDRNTAILFKLYFKGI